MRRISIIVLCLLLLWHSSSDAVLGIGDLVWDPTNWIENAATALNTLNTVFKLVTVIENQVIDLTPFDAFPAEGTAVLEEVVGLVTSIRALMPFDPDAVEGIFEVLYPPAAAVPCTREDLLLWQATARSQTRLAHLDAMRAQGMIGRLANLIPVLMGILQQVFTTIGTVTGTQQIGQFQKVLTEESTRLSTITGTFDRAVTSRHAYEVTEAASFDCLREWSISTWGTR